MDESAYAEAIERFTALDGLPSAKLSIAEIMKAAETVTGFTPADLCGKTRDPQVVRDEAMLIANECGYSSTRIGRAFGGRDHSTVLTAIKRAKSRRARQAFARVAAHD